MILDEYAWRGTGFYLGGEMGSEHEVGARLHLKLAREPQYPIYFVR